MAKIKVTLACGQYDRTWPLANGQIQPEGVDLNYFTLPPEELFWRMAVHGEFDASEFSLGAMSILKERGDHRFVGIPVFPSRFFRHSSIFINSHSGIRQPEDLKGRRVGVPDYTMTANTWIRGFLEHDYGVKPTDLHWVTGGLNEPGRKQRVATRPIEGLQVTHTETSTWTRVRLMLLSAPGSRIASATSHLMSPACSLTTGTWRLSTTRGPGSSHNAPHHPET